MAEESNAVQQIVKAFQSLSTMQKSMVIAISAIVIMFLSGLGIWATQEPMGLLMTGLNPTDTNTVVETLKRQKVKYEIGSDQQSIYVPKKQVPQLRVQIAGEGNLVGDSFGYEKLESPGLTTTDLSQRNTYWRSLEKHLAHTLSKGMPYLVTNATVHLTPANESIFVREKEDAKASVLLTLRSRRMPSEENMHSIVYTVANGTPGLRPEDVSVVDQFGRHLTKKAPPSSLTEFQKAIQREEEDVLATKVRELLEPAVGRGGVIVSASLELDFDKIQIKEETFDPQGQVERAISEASEKSTRRELPPGIPGTPENVAPADPGLGNQNIWEMVDKSDSVTNFEISSTVRAIEKNPGTTKRLSVSVMLDYRPTYPLNERGIHEFVPVPWTDEQIEKYRSQVAAAVGFDSARGDTISVESFPFVSAMNPIEEAAAKRQYWIELAKFMAPFALIFLSVVVWFIYKLATRKKALPVDQATIVHVDEEAEEVIERVVVPPKTVEELRAEIEQEFAADSASQATEVQRREVIKQRIAEIITVDPENAASLVRSWLIDDEAR